MTLRVVQSDFLPADGFLADAARGGVAALVIRHLRDRNDRTPPPRGMPKTDYWADAADSVTSEARGGAASVTIDKEGAALHYEGGTVRPKNGMALAIPIDPAVAGIWPSEAAGTGADLALVWPRNSSHGFLKDPETGELLYLLIPKADIPADPTVLPADADILAAAEAAVTNALETIR